MTRNTTGMARRLDALEAKALAAKALAAPPPVRSSFSDLLLELLESKLLASKALSDSAAALLRDPAWCAKQDPASLAHLAAWLDQSAMGLGDRLAANHRREP